ncbi:RNA pseudouridine synthase 2, chloroplastic-like isoform X3 [Musa acuminata AAA Group]|uniref:RNA pseudouridine synthase 2, chloroplastic-like isoform X3 n=1 Tax=Musa acuminata AAA Group TaxID=214697 RepID=UPI0031DC4065
MMTMQPLLPAAASSSSFSSLNLLRRNPNRSRVSPRALQCSSYPDLDPESPPPRGEIRVNHAGVRLEERVEVGAEKTRIDSWISSRIRGVSRARIQSSIRSGLVAVNGRTVNKVSHIIKGGDMVSCMISKLQPLKAEPEDMPLDIVYEDEHVLVVNKPAHMVVHPAPGNANGTLVNAILHHCRLPIRAFANNIQISDTEECSESSDSDTEEVCADQSSMEEVGVENYEALVRPGIVHRLDKGTSGLLVVAKVQGNRGFHGWWGSSGAVETGNRSHSSDPCACKVPWNSPVGRRSVWRYERHGSVTSQTKNSSNLPWPPLKHNIEIAKAMPPCFFNRI